MLLDLLRPVPDSPRAPRGHSLSALPISIVVHVLIVLALIVIPLLATDVLPDPARGGLEWDIVTPVVPDPPPQVRKAPPAMTTEVPANPDAAPSEAPSGVRPESGIERTELQEAMTTFERGVVPGVDAGTALGPTISDAPPPPAPETPLRARVHVREPIKVVDVRPLYPETARIAKVEGVVIIEAVISPSGSVQDARVLRSKPLLDEAALAAVRQWKYTPTLVNGKPVAVIITVTVNFTLH